jgi:hypothetical protein
MTVDTLGRALETYRRTTESRSAIVLIVANLIPLVGVLFFGWSLLTILVLYWIENGIVGFWNVPRIILAQGSVKPGRPPQAAARLGPISAAPELGAPAGFARLLGSGGLQTAGRVGLAIFFVVHYGIFWRVHGIFVFDLPMFLLSDGPGLLPGCGDEDPVGSLQPCGGPFGDIVWSNVWIAALALFLSHGASFLVNYIGAGEYITASPAGQMRAVYGRVVVLHITILGGAFAVAFLGAPVGALLILIVLKTAFDLGLHLRQHRAAALPFPPPPAPPPGVAGPV